MKRWGLVWIVAILSCVPLFIYRATNPEMLNDSDTRYLLSIINQQRDPLYWFTHDWPLRNHFYRPISTLLFEFDNAVYGSQAWGFGLTNVLLCCACIFLLAWLLRELTDSIPITIAGTALFGLWHWNGPLAWILPLLGYGVYAVGFAGVFRHGFKVWRWLPAVGALGLLVTELNGMVPLYSRMIAWIPGRTASTMAVFCLLAMAAYARYERLSAIRTEPVPTALDEPAGTRSTVLSAGGSRFAWMWAILAIVAVLFALGSYEQAVMLPAALLGVAVSLRLQRYRVRWAWQIAFWACLVLYMVARRAFLPDGNSGYQEQQLRYGPGVFFDLANYALPCLSSLYTLLKTFEIAFLMTDMVYKVVWEAYQNVSGFLAARRHWRLALTGYALSFLAYLPMAWLNQFDHYHYWPMALRSLFVVVLAWGTWELIVNAVSPPARQAPPRPVPAPGSLPHR